MIAQASRAAFRPGARGTVARGMVARFVPLAVALVAAVSLACGGGPQPAKPSPAADASLLGPDGAPATAYDRTTGEPCLSDDACKGAGGPGTNRCSNGAAFVRSVDGVPAQRWPTPVCLPPLPPPGSAAGNCDPAPAGDPQGTFPHFCDGPDVPSSPGLCVPFALDAPQSGQGICYPKCGFGAIGEASGCAGGNACQFFAFVAFGPPDASGGASATGFGFCQGGCQSDVDCAALGPTFSCQVDLGFCTDTPIVRTLGLGDPCSGTDGASGACNCAFNGSTNSGYCTTACVVGATPCPTGWVCDTVEPAVISFPGSSDAYPLPGPTPGMVGTCAPSCSVDAGVSSAAIDSGDATGGADDAGGSALCPGSSVCVAFSAAGPDCQP